MSENITDMCVVNPVLTFVLRAQTVFLKTGTGHASQLAIQVFVRGGTIPLVSKVPPPRS